MKSKLLFIHYRKQKATVEWQKKENPSVKWLKQHSAQLCQNQPHSLRKSREREKERHLKNHSSGFTKLTKLYGCMLFEPKNVWKKRKVKIKRENKQHENEFSAHKTWFSR